MIVVVVADQCPIIGLCVAVVVVVAAVMVDAMELMRLVFPQLLGSTTQILRRNTVFVDAVISWTYACVA